MSGRSFPWHLLDPGFDSFPRLSAVLDEVSHDSPHFLHTNAEPVIYNRPQPIPVTSCLFHKAFTFVDNVLLNKLKHK
jgi:hypothetical protein